MYKHRRCCRYGGFGHSSGRLTCERNLLLKALQETRLQIRSVSGQLRAPAAKIGGKLRYNHDLFRREQWPFFTNYTDSHLVTAGEETEGVSGRAE